MTGPRTGTSLRALLVVSASILAVLAGAADSRADDITAGVQLAAVTSPPPEHRADPVLPTYVVRVGPYAVNNYGVVKHATAVTPPPIPGWIVGMDARVVDPAGQPIAQSAVMLHHFLITNGGPDGKRRDGACPQRPVNERFYGTSEELRAITFPRGYGYPTAANDRWKMVWMVMNHRAEPRQVYLEYRVTVDPRPQTAVKPYWLSVVPCVSDMQYTVPGGGPPMHARVKRIRMPVNGRIVAIGGHMHGGGIGLRLSQPRCGDRELTTSWPAYAAQSDPLYQVKPLLHEPDPKSITWWQSASGWPVVANEPLKVTAVYDGTRPHMRVMGIAHVYVATGPPAPPTCVRAPPDAQLLGPSFSGGRPWPPPVQLTLAKLGPGGIAREISRPRGETRFRGRKAEVSVQEHAFSPANLSIAAGGVVTWEFKDYVQHDVTVVTAPRGFAADYSRRGGVYRQRLTVPGAYRLYCSLHPTRMSQYVRVRRRAATG